MSIFLAFSLQKRLEHILNSAPRVFPPSAPADPLAHCHIPEHPAVGTRPLLLNMSKLPHVSGLLALPASWGPHKAPGGLWQCPSRGLGFHKDLWSFYLFALLLGAPEAVPAGGQAPCLVDGEEQAVPVQLFCPSLVICFRAESCLVTACFSTDQKENPHDQPNSTKPTQIHKVRTPANTAHLP